MVADLTTIRCERCGRSFPGVSRQALRRNSVNALVLLGALSVLCAYALIR